MARLTLAVLGPLQVLLDDAPIRTFESDKARALLAYLVAEADRAHRRDALAGLLWPEHSDQAARHNLSQALLNVRRSIGDLTAEPAFLLITRDTLQFNCAADYRLDLADFAALLTACEQHAHRHAETCTPCARQLELANTLYRGSFLAGFFLKDSPAFEEWALLKNVRNEWVLDIEGLRVPTDDRNEEIESYSAITLFMQSARRAQAGWTLAASDAPALVRICRIVDGMPLGLELAASWVRALNCAEIADEIERSRGFLTSSMRDLPERHRSLRAVVDHSWRLLERDAQQVFQQLAIFRGGFRREAAASVVLSSEFKVLNSESHTSELKTQNPKLLPLLTALVDKSLLRRNSSGRYELHEFVRQYADEHLRASGINDQVRARHLAFFLNLAEQAEPELVRSRSKQWMERLDAEAENLRGALEWCRITHDAESWLRLAGALWNYWEGRCLLHEGLGWLEGALAAGQGALALPGLVLRPSRNFWTAAASARTQALIGMCHLSRRYGDYTRALARAEECAQLCNQLGDRWGQAAAFQIWGRLLRDQGDYIRGESFLEQALAIYRELGDQQAIGFSITTLAILAAQQADYHACNGAQSGGAGAIPRITRFAWDRVCSSDPGQHRARSRPVCARYNATRRKPDAIQRGFASTRRCQCARLTRRDCRSAG